MWIQTLKIGQILNCKNPIREYPCRSIIVCCHFFWRILQKYNPNFLKCTLDLLYPSPMDCRFFETIATVQFWYFPDRFQTPRSMIIWLDPTVVTIHFWNYIDIGRGGAEPSTVTSFWKIVVAMSIVFQVFVLCLMPSCTFLGKILKCVKKKNVRTSNTDFKPCFQNEVNAVRVSWSGTL